MKYDDAKSRVFAVGEIKDGYDPNPWRRVEFALDTDGSIHLVHDSGCFALPIPPVRNWKEAYYLLRDWSWTRAVFATRLSDVQMG